MGIIASILKISGRLYFKKKAFFIIVLSGLSLGFSAFLTLFYYVSFEYSYDKFNTNADRIYRVQLERTYPDRVDLTAGVSAGVGPAMSETFPEVEEYTKLWGTKHLNNIIQNGDKSLEEEKLYFATKGFFKVFSFKFIKGDKETALIEPNSVVITKSFAKRLFGDEDPLGKSFIYHNPWNSLPLTVTGITEDPPVNSHLDYNVLVSLQIIK